MNILMLHRINHNMFDKRDPKLYGTVTLAEIDATLRALGKDLGATVECFQTNSEAAMAERIHRAFTEGKDAVLINAGAWTHYDYGIRDALAILTVPIVEGKKSYGAQVAEALKSKPQLVYVSTYYPEGSKIAGSLLAAGKLGAKDNVLVADFRVRGVDSTIGSVITEAVRTWKRPERKPAP